MSERESREWERESVRESRWWEREWEREREGDGV